MTTHPTISLCMIVRDEAALVPSFLAAAEGLYDELCVVDTGSGDNTIELLATAGARVEQFTWRDDFSAARNASLQMARGDWIVVLDADERPDAEAKASIRQISTEARLGAATVCMRNVFEHNYTTLTHLMRMFRRDDAVRFHHPIHEDVASDVMGYLFSSGRELGRVGGIIDHSGYLRERMVQRGKKQLSDRILSACLQRDRSDLYNWFKLCESARFFKDEARLQEACAGALSALEAADEAAIAEAHFGGELATLLSCHHHRGHPDAELAFLDRWEQRLVPSAALRLRRGEVLEAMGQPEAAAAAFRSCVDLHARTSNLQLSSVRPLLGLARLAIARGDLANALGYVEVAMGHNPRDPEMLLALTALCQQMAGQAGLARVVDAYRQSYGDCSELQAALETVEETQLLSGHAIPSPPSAGAHPN